MKVKEAIELINSSWNCYSLESAEYLLTECKFIKRQDYNNFSWYTMATEIYEVDDGYIGVRGVSELKSQIMHFSDCNEHCVAEEYKAGPTGILFPITMETEKKYKLTDEFITIGNKKLYRIVALKTFSNIKKCDRGGFIESEGNLSQKGDCWIYGDAKVYDNARVYDNAKIYGNSEVFDNAEVFGDAIIYGNAKIYGNAHIFNDAMVLHKSKVFDNAKVFDGARVYGKANIYGRAKVFDGAKVYSHVKVFGESEVRGGAELYGNAEISNTSDYIVFKNWWSSGRYFTWTRSNNMWSVGCFYGSGQELIDKAYEESELSGMEYERVVKYVESILKS